LNIPTVRPKPTEISADMDVETIAEIVSDRLMEIVKKSFESKTPKVAQTDTLPVLYTSLLGGLKRTL
jgi:hypothetical protein